MTRRLFPLIMLGILLVLAVTALHALAWWLAPFHSAHPEAPAWYGILLFQGTLIGSIWLGFLLVSKRQQPYAFDYAETFRKMPCHWILAISVSGLVFHLIAKASLFESISLSCFTQLRSAWMAHDRSTDPTWLRMFSMLGYVGAHFTMPGLLICALKITLGRQYWKTWLSFIGLTMVITIFAGVIVSRTIMVTALTMVCFGVLLALFGKAKLDARRLRTGMLSVVFFMAVVAIFNHQIFKSKIACSATTTEQYVMANLADTGVTISGIREDGRVAPSFGLHSSILPTLHYLNHGIWNYAMILDTRQRGAPVLLAFMSAYLSRLGLMSNPEGNTTRIYSQGGATLPGASYHDFGYPGLLVVAVFTAAMWVAGVYLLLRGGASSLFGLTLVVGAGLTIVLSLLFVAPATISYPFTIFAFFVCAIHEWLSSRIRKARSG
ncbi:hypothetical protein [Sulfuritortus calidifontis]|uniref:hypothetical protein n=1 Tax=Sulfuritortus calidifontis TaxID=1914471 RepID=UPI000F8161B9|nr:hypothetical protein [Sulfuritortus calidifontis]